MIRRLFEVLIITTSLSALSACSPATQDTGVRIISATSRAVSDLITVAAQLGPDSLQSFSANLPAGSCTQPSQFGYCESQLTSTALAMVANILRQTATDTASIGRNLGTINSNSSGTTSNGIISWKKVDENNYSILVKDSQSSSRYFIAAQPGGYTIKIDRAPVPAMLVTHGLEMILNFTSSETWSLDLFVTDPECDIQYPMAPQRAQYRIYKTGGLWTGKVMQIIPRWATPVPSATLTCTAGSPTEIAHYLDFVGDAQSTKAELFVMPSTINDLTIMTGFDLPDFCANFPALCMNGISNAVTSVFANPFCSDTPASDPNFGNACAANSTVTAASFSFSTLWITPDLLRTRGFLLPSAL